MICSRRWLPALQPLGSPLQPLTHLYLPFLYVLTRAQQAWLGMGCTLSSARPGGGALWSFSKPPPQEGTISTSQGVRSHGRVSSYACLGRQPPASCRAPGCLCSRAQKPRAPRVLCTLKVSWQLSCSKSEKPALKCAQASASPPGIPRHPCRRQTSAGGRQWAPLPGFQSCFSQPCGGSTPPSYESSRSGQESRTFNSDVTITFNAKNNI